MLHIEIHGFRPQDADDVVKKITTHIHDNAPDRSHLVVITTYYDQSRKLNDETYSFLRIIFPFKPDLRFWMCLFEPLHLNVEFVAMETFTIAPH